MPWLHQGARLGLPCAAPGVTRWSQGIMDHGYNTKTKNGLQHIGHKYAETEFTVHIWRESYFIWFCGDSPYIYSVLDINIFAKLAFNNVIWSAIFCYLITYLSILKSDVQCHSKLLRTSFQANTISKKTHHFPKYAIVAISRIESERQLSSNILSLSVLL